MTKLRIFELTILTIFLLSLGSIFLFLTEWGMLWMQILLVFLSIISYFSLLSIYSVLTHPTQYTSWLIPGHALLCIILSPFISPHIYDAGAFLLISGVYIILLFSFLKTLKNELKERITFSARKIVFPFLTRVILGFSLLVAFFTYAHVLSTDINTDEIRIPHQVLTNQVQTFEPVIQVFIPDYKNDLTVQEFLTRQIDNTQETLTDNLDISQEQLQQLPEAQQDQLSQELEQQSQEKINTMITQQIERLEEQYNISISPQDTLPEVAAQAFNTLLKNTFGKHITPFLVALISAGLVLLGIVSFMPIYRIFITGGIMIYIQIFTQSNLLTTSHETVEREIIHL